MIALPFPTRPATRPGTAGGLAALLAALLLALLLALPQGAAAKRKPRPLYWGAVIGKQLTGEAAPWDMGAIDAFERQAGKRISLLGFSSPFFDCAAQPCSPFHFPVTAMEQLRRRGTIPFLSWGSQGVPGEIDQPYFSLAAVARGDHDAYLTQFAEDAAEWGRPFFLRLNPEMNGFWFPWGASVNGNTARRFVAAWRHVHDVFRRAGATKATWVWCPNVDFNRNLVPLHRLYPGHRYVDWTCLDGFNWGRTYNSVGWQSFDQIFRSTYRRVVRIAPRKPMVIGEMASEERGGSKARWIRHALGTIPKRYKKVRAVIWFNERDQGMHWPIESSRRARNAFRKAIKRQIYRPNVFAELPARRIEPPGRNLAR